MNFHLTSSGCFFLSIYTMDAGECRFSITWLASVQPIELWELLSVIRAKANDPEALGWQSGCMCWLHFCMYSL